MTLDSIDNPPSEIVTRRAAQKAAGIVNLSLKSCAWILKKTLPGTPEGLRDLGIMLKSELRNLQKSVFQLEDCEPDVIIAAGYLLKKSDVTDQLSQRMAKINENSAIFGQDPISIINTTCSDAKTRSFFAVFFFVKKTF